jgi:hypothetical protein
MKVDILVPTTLSDITLEQYQKFVKLNSDENKNTSFLLHKMVEIFCDLDLKNVAKIKFSNVKNIIKNLDKIFLEKPPLKNTFILNNKKFGFIPILDEITLGEYVDLDQTLSDWQKMHKAMSVLYRPVIFEHKEKYQIETYDGDKYAEEMKKAPLDVVFGCIVFFYNLSNELLEITLNYLNKDLKEMSMEQKQILEESGIGINQFMDLLKGTLQDSTK